MRTVQLIATVLGASALAIGVAQAGPMGGGGGMGMSPGATPASGPMGVNGMNNQNAGTDTCGDNTATRIPCTHHDSKAKAKAKTKGAASAEGANASATTGAAANVPGAGANGSAGSTTSATPGDTPH